jgi:LAO/AO transport system kinase
LPVTDVTAVAALGRLLSALEDGDHAVAAQRRALAGPIASCVVGITGPPGAGKSTLIDGLVSRYRRARRPVGVLAVDPSSAISGGALLGDRIRMHRHAADPEVFIRSIGSRGVTNGLALSVFDATRALSAHGYDPVIIETVGVGQVESGIAGSADVRVLVLSSASGDRVQAAKAGILELADIVVVNKADLPGTGELLRELRRSTRTPDGLAAEVIAAVATDGTGLEQTFEAIGRRWDQLRSSEAGRRRRLQAVEAELATRLRDKLERGPLRQLQAAGAFTELAAAVNEGRMAADDAAERLCAAVTRPGD